MVGLGREEVTAVWRGSKAPVARAKGEEGSGIWSQEKGWKDTGQYNNLGAEMSMKYDYTVILQVGKGRGKRMVAALRLGPCLKGSN